MKSHRMSIYIFLIIFLLTSAIGLITEYYTPQSEHKAFWQNVALGVWCSNLLVLILEYVNYSVARSDLLHQYTNESQKLQNKLLYVREKSGEQGVDLAKVIISLNEALDFTHLFDIYSRISFLNSSKKNRYKFRIESIEKQLHGYHRNLIEFSQTYRLAPNKSEQEYALRKYIAFDKEAFDILHKELTALREVIS